MKKSIQDRKKASIGGLVLTGALLFTGHAQACCVNMCSFCATASSNATMTESLFQELGTDTAAGFTLFGQIVTNSIAAESATISASVTGFASVLSKVFTENYKARAKFLDFQYKSRDGFKTLNKLSKNFHEKGKFLSMEGTDCRLTKKTANTSFNKSLNKLKRDVSKTLTYQQNEQDGKYNFWLKNMETSKKDNEKTIGSEIGFAFNYDNTSQKKVETATATSSITSFPPIMDKTPSSTHYEALRRVYQGRNDFVSKATLIDLSRREQGEVVDLYISRNGIGNEEWLASMQWGVGKESYLRRMVMQFSAQNYYLFERLKRTMDRLLIKNIFYADKIASNNNFDLRRVYGRIVQTRR